MEQLIQALTAYTSTLEQQLAALEARVALLEAESGKLKTENEALEAQIATLRAEVTSLSAAGVVATPAEEPEVEIELIVEDPQEQETPEELVEEPQEESAEESQEEPAQEMPLEPLESLEIIEEEEPVAELIVEPAPQPEVKAEPVAAPQPAPRPMPQQTSLFGAAVEDIRQAISLGDRFLFQRELFAGNGELMQKTLDELNALGSLEEAMDYVADNFEWDSDSTAVQLFENVLKRRFG
jgi:hypothetical protein